MKNLPAPPLGHSVVLTEDGSLTLFSHAFQEACHSTTGAKAETALHYIKGCEISKKLEAHNEIQVLEIGFGVGVGLLTTLEVLTPENRLQFVSVELDKNLIEWFRARHHSHALLKNLRWEKNLLMLETPKISITIIQGDARETLAPFLGSRGHKFGAIYQDAFSPRRNPSLWSVEWFELLKSASAADVILSTYSASTSIRKSLLRAGWSIQPGEKFGPKKSSTRAYLNRPSDKDLLLQLDRSPTPPITDLLVGEFKNKINI
jgi:tRNA U34 5-methylaminomethyl-2-thiouridine-forming methyltransferase MnmC